MHYPFTPTCVPGAPRPDLAELLWLHACRSDDLVPMDVATVYADRMSETTHPENFYEIGTDLRGWYGYAARVIASADCAEDILRRHRRMAHRAWTRDVYENEGDLPSLRAWLCARRYCGLPT